VARHCLDQKFCFFCFRPYTLQFFCFSAVMNPQCHSCHKRDATYMCAKCKHAGYCSATCQKAAWAIHSQYCYSEGDTILSALEHHMMRPRGAIMASVKKQQTHPQPPQMKEVLCRIQEFIPRPRALEDLLIYLREKNHTICFSVLIDDNCLADGSHGMLIKELILDATDLYSVGIESALRELNRTGYIPFLLVYDSWRTALHGMAVVCAVIPRVERTTIWSHPLTCSHLSDGYIMICGGPQNRLCALGCRKLSTAYLLDCKSAADCRSGCFTLCEYPE